MKNVKNIVSVFVMIIISAFIFNGCSKQSKEQTNKTENNTAETSNKQTASKSGKELSVISSQSKLEWNAKKVTGEHFGTVDIGNGNVYVDNAQLTGGDFEIDFTTIKVGNVDDPGMNAKFTGHLKSDDFFSAEKFPMGKFEIISAEQKPDDSGNNYIITGNLTIKGITNQISFPANVNINGDNLTASADFKIDRTLWDIKFRSGKFYENLGDNLIYDEFNIKFNITAK